MPGGGARGASTAAVRGSAGAGGISGCPAFGTAGCAPVTCVAGGFAGEGGAGDAAAGSGVFVPAAEDGSAAFGAGVDLQDRTASQMSAALLRMDPRENGAGILRGGACTAHVGVAVCVAACAFSGSAIRMTWEMGKAVVTVFDDLRDVARAIRPLRGAPGNSRGAGPRRVSRREARGARARGAEPARAHLLKL